MQKHASMRKCGSCKTLRPPVDFIDSWGKQRKTCEHCRELRKKYADRAKELRDMPPQEKPFGSRVPATKLAELFRDLERHNL